ncbi:drug/metabolite exporter YedA [Paludibaculum fermentans]|uniref:Drug/metabolite exporter YedA n=1 Tax=Paludibaculum fermentans TaxID=1473598 RepID=A0A7S7NSW9_PALFE|nr:drug/metabolite exporter YedA [Paludibaculum fermentans]QOY89111.1 drug/metabolite exporter YedA [Paludibaculum fermentans]
MPDVKATATRWRLLLAFAIVYVVWGSTYLGIRYAIETIPPLLMAGTRFLTAGSILLIWSLLRNKVRPTWKHWRSALVMGTLMLLCGNGFVTLAEQRIPSGLAALLVASEPLMLVLVAWAAPRGLRPTGRDFAGIFLGFAGVAVLVWPSNVSGPGADLIGAALVLSAALGWAVGSIYGIDAPTAPAPILANGMTMLCGGTLLFLSGVFRGELPQVQPEKFSVVSMAAWGYLVVFGSILAFSAYTYLLTATTPAKASTYAFVNPVVAVMLGWAIAGEPLSVRAFCAMAAIVAAVVILTAGHRKKVEPESGFTAEALTVE